MGIDFDSVTHDQARAVCVDWCGRSGSRARTVMTLNASLLIQMRSDTALADANRAGDLILADGQSVVWATRLLGRPLADRVTGVDLMTSLLGDAEANDLSVYFLGATSEVLTDLIETCRRRHPGLTIAGSHHGYFSPDDDKLIVDDINESGADIVFIGMPSPRKELWGEDYRHLLDVSVIMGVGGSFDVLAGHVTRAPVWVQRLGGEWAWRLAMEPRRLWRRYLVTNTAFLYHLGRELATARVHRR